MVLPFSAQQIFFVAILVFIVAGFQRGWRRELVSLVFILLASFIVRQDTSDSVGAFFARLPSVIGLAAGADVSAQNAQNVTFLSGPFWSLVIFIGLVALGYYVGNKVFPRPSTPQERFIGVVPAVISGAFVLGYLSNYFRATAGQPSVSVAIESPDPANYIAVIFVIGVLAVLIAVVAGRVKAKK